MYRTNCFSNICFLIVEGYKYTHNKVKYGLSLFVFALISEIPYNMVYSGTLFFKVQNVYFTLFLGYLCICIMDKRHSFNSYFKIGLLFLIMMVALLINPSHGYEGVGLIVAMYSLYDSKLSQAIICTILSPRYMMFSIFAFIPINMYNGRKGFISNRNFKWFFYVYYPGHLLILYFIKSYIWGYS